MSSRLSSDSLGDRFKAYESINSKDTFIPNLPICIRLDGRAFHTLTRGLEKPFSQEFQSIMQLTTTFLVDEFKPLIAYTQSDEISLIFLNNYYNPVIFGGRRDKLMSVLASYATGVFTSLYINSTLVKTEGLIPSFDCRGFNVPDLSEASNYLIWRELDASKNSVLSAGYAHFTRDEMFKKNLAAIKGMLYEERGIIWEDYPHDFKYGSYIQRQYNSFTDNTFASVIKDLTLKSLPHADRIRTILGDANDAYYLP